MIGIIALAGIMVRNSVLLIDFIQISLKEGNSRHDDKKQRAYLQRNRNVRF